MLSAHRASEKPTHMFRIGIPAKGSRYFKGEAYHQVLNELERGRDVILLGPRRSGKTSLMMTVAEELQQTHKAARTVFSDLRGERNLWSLLAKLSPNDKLNSMLTELTYLNDQRAGEVMILASKILETAAEGYKSVYLLLDEVGYFLQEESTTDLFIEFLDLCGQHKRITLLLSGEALEISRILSRARRIHPNYDKIYSDRFRSIELQPLNQDQIKLFVESNLDSSEIRKLGVSENDLDRFAEILAPAWPFEVAIVWNQLIEIRDDDKEDDFETDLIRAIATPLLRLTGSRSIEMIIIEQLPKRELSAADTILETLAISKTDITIDDILGIRNPRHTESELLLVAKHLQEIGIIRIEGKQGILKPATGLLGFRLHQEYGGPGDIE